MHILYAVRNVSNAGNPGHAGNPRLTRATRKSATLKRAAERDWEFGIRLSNGCNIKCDLRKMCQANELKYDNGQHETEKATVEIIKIRNRKMRKCEFIKYKHRLISYYGIRFVLLQSPSRSRSLLAAIFAQLANEANGGHARGQT